MNSEFTSSHARPDRIPVDIPVAITSVLSSGEATLGNLTEYGALIEGMSLPKGTQFQIEYRGQTVYGFVVWAEADRFGARFPFTLHEGPLHSELEHARMRNEMQQHGFTNGSVVSGGHRSLPQFGRRGLH